MGQHAGMSEKMIMNKPAIGGSTSRNRANKHPKNHSKGVGQHERNPGSTSTGMVGQHGPDFTGPPLTWISVISN